jgi:hypothetical protein
MMRKQYLRILIALIGFGSFGMAAKGQVLDQVVVNIPYDFVVAGKTLPAGTYRVNRATEIDAKALILSNFDARASVIIVPSETESHTGKPEVNFEQVGDKYLLSKIETEEHSFTISISGSEVLEAAARSHSGTSGSESASGSN